jgi:hypothetical protein
MKERGERENGEEAREAEGERGEISHELRVGEQPQLIRVMIACHRRQPRCRLFVRIIVKYCRRLPKFVCIHSSCELLESLSIEATNRSYEKVEGGNRSGRRSKMSRRSSAKVRCISWRRWIVLLLKSNRCWAVVLNGRSTQHWQDLAC